MTTRLKLLGCLVAALLAFAPAASAQQKARVERIDASFAIPDDSAGVAVFATATLTAPLQRGDRLQLQFIKDRAVVQITTGIGLSSVTVLEAPGPGQPSSYTVCGRVLYRTGYVGQTKCAAAGRRNES